MKDKHLPEKVGIWCVMCTIKEIKTLFNKKFRRKQIRSVPSNCYYSDAKNIDAKCLKKEVHKNFYKWKKENYNRKLFDKNLYEKDGWDKISVRSVENHDFTAKLMGKFVRFRKKKLGLSTCHNKVRFLRYRTRRRYVH